VDPRAGLGAVSKRKHNPCPYREFRSKGGTQIRRYSEFLPVVAMLTNNFVSSAIAGNYSDSILKQNSGCVSINSRRKRHKENKTRR
jgi:hypothetical protein